MLRNLNFSRLGLNIYGIYGLMNSWFYGFVVGGLQVRVFAG